MSDERRNPWFKFYPTDWRADSGLRACSAAARGLWLEMLTVMHEAPDRGFLMVGRIPATVSDLISITGLKPAEIKSGLAELEARDVFSRDNSDRIFCRKMVRDSRKSSTNSENVKKRWDTENTEEISGRNTTRNTNGNTKGDTKALHHARAHDRDLEARGQKEDSVSNDTGGGRLAKLLDGEINREPGNSSDAWAMVKHVLTARGGARVSAAGSFVGKLKGAHKLSDDDLAEIAKAAWLEGTEDVAAFMTACAARIAADKRAAAAGEKPIFRGRAPSPASDDGDGYESDLVDQEREVVSWLKNRRGDPGLWDRQNYGFPPPNAFCRFDRALLARLGVKCEPRPGSN